MATVEALLGVPVDYYAQVDFGAFVRFIDEIGGVKIDIAEKIKVDPLGDNNTQERSSRHPDPAGRPGPGLCPRPQNRGRRFRPRPTPAAGHHGHPQPAHPPQMLPMLIAKAPTLYNELSSGITPT